MVCAPPPQKEETIKIALQYNEEKRFSLFSYLIIIIIIYSYFTDDGHVPKRFLNWNGCIHPNFFSISIMKLQEASRLLFIKKIFFR